MSTNSPDQFACSEAGDPPDWLLDLLTEVRAGRALRVPAPPAEAVSETFRQNCRQAAGAALLLVPLRRERERLGFVPLPLRDYVEGMAQVLGVSLAGVLAWLGVETWPRPTEATAAMLARLGHALGMPLRELLAHVRIAIGRELGCAPLPLLLARRRAGGSSRGPLEECEAILGQLETQYEAQPLSELRRTEAAVRATYQALGADPDGRH